MTSSRGERRYVSFLLILAVVFTFSTFLNTTFNDSRGVSELVKNSGGITMVEPGVVSLELRSLSLGTDSATPAFLLSADAGIRCDKVSKLIVSQYIVEDTLYLDVGAYAIKSEGEISNGCEERLQLAEVLIPMQEIISNGDIKYAKVILRDAVNEYRFHKDAYAIYLEPLSAKNVVLPQQEDGEKIVVLCLKKSSSAAAPEECRE